MRAEIRPPPAPVVKRAVTERDEDKRLDNFLARESPRLARDFLYRLIRTGQVRINGKRAKPDSRLRAGDIVRLPPAAPPKQPPSPPPAAALPRLPVVFENDDYCVIDKPAGVSSHGGVGERFGAVETLRQIRAGAQIELAHRIDKRTSGVLVFAKNTDALRLFHDRARAREIEKTYLVVVCGRWRQRASQIRLPLVRAAYRAAAVDSFDAEAADSERARAALTATRLLRQWPGFALVEAKPHTGRMHQIRVHLAAVGLPVVGDDKYGDFARNREVGRALPSRARRLFLHAAQIDFVDRGGVSIRARAPTPTPFFVFEKVFAAVDAAPRR